MAKKCEFCGTEIANFGSFGRYLFACPNRNLQTATKWCVSSLDRPSFYDKIQAAAEYETRVKEAKSAQQAHVAEADSGASASAGQINNRTNHTPG